MKTLKKNRLRDLVSWRYITQAQANQMYREYLKMFGKQLK